MTENNWYVISGTTVAGKTTLVEILAERGFDVVYEAARVYIDQEMQKGQTIKEIRADELQFQEKVLQIKIELEKKLDKNKIIFFDRGIPDSDAYYRLQGKENDKFLEDAMRNCWYKKVFLLDFLDMEKDYARIETREEQIRIHDLLEESYKKIKIPIVKVPTLKSKEARADFVLNSL